MVHKFSNAGLRRMVFRIAISMVLLFAGLLLGLGYGMGWYALPAARLILLTVTLGVASVVSIVFAVRRQQRAWLSFELEVEADAIVRRMEGFEELRVTRSDVVGITEVVGRGLAVNAGGARPLLWIDAALEGYEQVKQTLAGWRPIAVRAPRDFGRIVMHCVLLAAVVGASGVAYTTDQLRWFLPTGVPLIVAGMWGVVYLPRNPNVDQFTRRAAWVGLMPAFALVWKLVVLLRGQG